MIEIIKEGESVNPFARAARPRGWRRWLPAFALVRVYQRSWLVKDLVAGLVLTAILVPTGMGYAEAAGLPDIYGLYATIVPLVAYSIFGPSRILVLGPDSALAGIIAATILPLAAGKPDQLVALAGLLAIMTGALCILAGLARFGYVTDLLSKPIRYGSKRYSGALGGYGPVQVYGDTSPESDHKRPPHYCTGQVRFTRPAGS